MHPTFDLQSHSTCSDGVLEPAEVVRRAAAAGVKLLALTDHDTVEGVPEAARAARAAGIRLSPALELSCVDGRHHDVHVLGYEVDVHSRPLLDALEDARADRVERTAAMVTRLEELGFAVDHGPLEERRAAGLTIGRPHIADAVLSHPANAERLAAEGIAGRDEFFPAYIVPGARAFVPRSRPTVAEGIDLIHAAGGVAVWAHPFWDLDDPRDALATLDRFARAGIDGVEAFYVAHTREQTELLHTAATERALLITGSSDFHAPSHEHFRAFARFELHGLEPVLGPIGAG